ncbi:MAG: zinc-dependent metalloprotease family protein, partial [Ignavibacteria bacterium]
MKNFTKFIFSALLVFSLFNIDTVNIKRDGITFKQNQLFAQDINSVWKDIPGSALAGKDLKAIKIEKFRSLKLNLNSFRNILFSAPFELSDRAKNSPYIIELPSPDGKLSKFYVTEYSMMESGLAAMYPEMKTYSIKGIDDPHAVGKIDLTSFGFHGMVLSPNGDYFINPLSLDNTENYISFYKSDYSGYRSFDCLVTEISSNSDFINNNNSIMTGQQLRTYRLACAATGEYTAFFGGTVALGQAAIVTSMNRVNGIYERDLSVRMTLVANNSSIVYTNSATDPYTNGNGSTMLGQNQTNCDAVIGTANYDIGHVFSTGGGGVAGLGVVCSNGNKARGVTGSTSPVGDPYDIDYVAHEMGHQFSGNHSFNGSTGSCSGGNRNASTAWEPGSASTIMGYAGICSPQDLQPNSDALFHSGNVSEITAFTQTGGGNSCPVTTNTGNTPPTVTVPAGGFTIPISTPFELTGSATDVETPGSLTYIWEEMDLGAAGAPTAPVGNAPIFRSFTPVVSPTRTFPKLSDLLNNTSTIGEILPTYTRTLSFRLTARDNNAGGGGINFNSISFNVNSAAGPFLVT